MSDADEEAFVRCILFDARQHVAPFDRLVNAARDRMNDEEYASFERKLLVKLRDEVPTFAYLLREKIIPNILAARDAVSATPDAAGRDGVARPYVVDVSESLRQVRGFTRVGVSRTDEQEAMLADHIAGGGVVDEALLDRLRFNDDAWVLLNGGVILCSPDEQRERFRQRMARLGFDVTAEMPEVLEQRE
jgi:hypothetical protein